MALIVIMVLMSWLIPASMLFAEDDTTPPVITITGNNPETVEVGAAYTDAGATATDDIGPSVVPVITTGTVDTAVCATYTLAYSATDTAGNTATASRTVNVVGTTPPIITLNGDQLDTITVSPNPVDANVGFTISFEANALIPIQNLDPLRNL